jgi:uncharacterized alkaline shock family protein YloU
MRPLSRLLRTFLFGLRGVRVSALVGPSGTGKSFRARLLAEKHGAAIIVDDGLVVCGDTILAGHWAKKERTLLAATRRALFDAPDHAREAREALRRSRFRKVLIVATSRRMASRIASALDLPRPTTVLRVEEIAGSAGVHAARGRRQRTGGHAAPFPLVTIRRSLFSAIAEGIRSLVRLADHPRERAGRAVRRVTGAGGRTAGGVAVSEQAVRQMVMHCVAEHDRRLTVEKVGIRKDGGMYSLEVGIGMPFGRSAAGSLHRLQHYILHSLESHAGLIVREVHLVVQSVNR